MISDQIQTGRLGVITGARLRTLRIHPLRSRRRPHCPCFHPPLPSPWPSRRPLPWMWALSRSCRPRDRMTMTKTSWASSVSYQQRHKPAPRDSELKEVALKKKVCVWSYDQLWGFLVNKWVGRGPQFQDEGNWTWLHHFEDGLALHGMQLFDTQGISRPFSIQGKVTAWHTLRPQESSDIVDQKVGQN